MRLRRYLFDMKSSEFRQLLENSLYNEVKNRIINESEEGSYDVFEVVCEGEPFEVCKTEEEAQEIVNKLEKQHPGKQFIIEKKTYESYDHMLDELDKMGEELQEKENQDMKKNKVKVGSLAEAILHAKENNKSKIVINEEVIDVNEKWKEMEEEETCEQCSMEEDMDEPQGGSVVDSIWEKYSDEAFKSILPSEFSDEFEYGDTIISYVLDIAIENGDIEVEEEDDVRDEIKQTYGEDLLQNFNTEEGESDETEEGDYGSDYDNLPDGSDMSMDEIDLAIGDDMSLDYDDKNKDLELPIKKKEKGFWSKLNDKFNNSLSDYEPDYHEKYIGSMAEENVEPNMCSECGSGEINEEGQCNECGYMKESKKSKLRLKESELVSLIGKMVTEAAKGQPGIPGIPGVTVTKRAQSASDKENKNYAKELSTKLKNYLNFDGNDNPEFPKPIGKGSKMAFRNTSDNEKKIEDNRGETNSDLTFDYEPSEGFKKRVKASLEGDSKMGNSSDAGNVVKDKVGKQIVDKKKRKVDDRKNKKDVSWGHSWIMPADVDIVAESKNKKTDLLKEEINKINKLSFYNKKTQ
jgi:hypothetical protein